jgi:transcriptional antiterminator NusG
MLMRNQPERLIVGQIVGYVEKPSAHREVCLVSGQWFVVATEFRQEKLAIEEIGHAGLVVYAPQIARSERHGRGNMRTILRYVFPSYLLVKCDPQPDHWKLITKARGVHRLLGCDSPKPIHEGEIEVIRLYEAEQAERQRDRERCEETAKRAREGGKSGLVWHFEPGERVRIKNGPFAAFYAQLESAVDDRDRISALVDLFGRRSTIELSAFDIEET